MKKILSLCINLLFFIISDAVPVKLIAGDRSVVKKDGVTHTISKYYVVPNDFDPNNVTNSTETSQSALRMNHSLFSKSVDAVTASEHQVSEKRAERTTNQTNENKAGVNNNEVNLRSGLNDVQVDVATQADDNAAKSTISVSTEQSLVPDDLGNLQVEPITKFTNVSRSVNEVNVYNSSEALRDGTSLIVENTTNTFERDVENELDHLILTKFGIAVQESSVKNLESFWKLIKLNIDRISNDDELLTKIEKISLLLNIFTNLYEAAELQKPVESMIDSIIDILQIPFVEKSNTNESQSEKRVSGDYGEECLRKCGLKSSKPQLDSNGTYLSETERLATSDNFELKNLDLQRRQRGDLDDGDYWVNNQPTNIPSQLLVPNNLNVGVPDGFNVRSSISTPTLNHVTREKNVQEDPKSNQTIPDSAEIVENLDNQPLTIESRFTDDLPWHIEDRTTDNLPWHIEDKKTRYKPWIIEHRTTNTLPWTIEDKGNKKVPLNVENRADRNWTIENKMGHSPVTLYQSRDPSVITHGDKILLHPNQHMTSTVHSVKQGVKKPYHLYTYVINPTTSLYEVPNSGNIVKTKSYGLPNSHGGNRIVYTTKPSPRYYESQFSLSKSSVDSSQTSNPQLKHMNYVSLPYDTSNEVNPSDLSIIANDDDQLKYLIGQEPETNHKPALLQPNTLPSDFRTNSDHDNGVLLANVPSNPFKSVINLDNTGPVSTANTRASADNIDVKPDIGDTEPNPYNPNINLNRIQQTNLHPGVISKASYPEYTNLPDDFDKPSRIYGGETYKQPGLISKTSYSSGYTNLLDDYDEPRHVYGRQTVKHPVLISTSSSSSGYTNLLDKHNKPVYPVQTHHHPGVVSSSVSSNSEYANVIDGYDKSNFVYDRQTHKNPDFEYTNLPNDFKNPIPDYAQHTTGHPGLITKLTRYPEYAYAVDDYDEPNPIYGREHKNSGFISKVSANSEYMELPNVYNNPITDYGQHIDGHSGQITKVTHYPEYTNELRIPVYGGQTHKHPGFMSKASSHSEFTNTPNDYYYQTSDGATDKYPVRIQTPVDSRTTEIEDNLLGSYNPYGQTVHIRPNHIAHLHRNQLKGLNYLKNLKLQLAPTYRLFTLNNLLKLRDTVIKTIEINGPNVYDNKALMKLRKIINIILILAEHLEEPEDGIEWYEKIFYNTQKNRHPLKNYVYNLIQQRWLHELMLVLYKNDFNFNILQNPKLFSFLRSWQFPNYVLNFMGTEELIQHNFDAPEVFDQTFSSQHGLPDKFATDTYDDVLEQVPENLESYVTNKVIDSYKTPNSGTVLRIAGVEAEPDANSIIHILQKYLHYKSFIEKQESVMIRDNKVEMLKQIILFLTEKGYDANTIADLMSKLYTAVYSIEGKDCQTHHANFAKNMYDIILPVLRRSGR